MCWLEWPWSNWSWTRRPWLAHFRGVQVVTERVRFRAFVPVGLIVILGVGLVPSRVEWLAVAIVGPEHSWLCVWWF